ncbi:7835_t:CDS:2 [Acaulospora morrowiae]|uniref:7835_t:CDS:1 n=1 Tax=Acaulospora morrowiae TaxID=94023 RepID=A0A9N8W2T9_9GLOM|nr:7835_t:CDS:2 [Acaulospora morrowiae]
MNTPNVDEEILTHDSNDTRRSLYRTQLFYDPEKHKTQSITRESTDSETREYIRTQWISEDFFSSDLIGRPKHNDIKSDKNPQPQTLIDPKFTFIEKFLERRQKRLITQRLLEDGSLSIKDINQNTYIAKSLPPETIQQIPSYNSEIPIQFMALLESEVFNKGPFDPKLIQWREFGIWACFTKVSHFNKRFRHHCHLLWSDVNHAHLEAEKKICEEYNIPKTFNQTIKKKLEIADEATGNVAIGGNFEGYYHVFNPQCFKNSYGETVVDFFDLANPTVAEDTRVVIDEYYVHNLNNKKHQSKEFRKELVEHFGAFTGNNNEPYTTANTASDHCIEHRKCVRELISGLQPLSKTVNIYFRETYPDLYAKMAKLDLGPNVPKLFGAFPTTAVNFNVISQFHRDLKDHRNTLCVVCPLGSYEGGQLVFPELKLIIYAKQGHAIAFRSNILVHGNLSVTVGIRHSVVFFIHTTTIKQNRKFGTLFDEYLDVSETLDNARPIVDNVKRCNKKLQNFSHPKLDSQKSMPLHELRSTKLRNHRRSHLDLEPARRGLPAQYKK